LYSALYRELTERRGFAAKLSLGASKRATCGRFKIRR
jgi:hypothetical protein